MSLSISPEAVDLIRERKQPVYLDMPRFIRGGCCAPNLQECPTVRFGAPPERERESYVEQSLGGVTVFVPRRMEQKRGDFTITVSSFLGMRRVVLEGWTLL
jgi:hypothetical protein